jgi:hypothetical protein
MEELKNLEIILDEDEKVILKTLNFLKINKSYFLHIKKSIINFFFLNFYFFYLTIFLLFFSGKKCLWNNKKMKLLNKKLKK